MIVDARSDAPFEHNNVFWSSDNDVVWIVLEVLEHNHINQTSTVRVRSITKGRPYSGTDTLAWKDFSVLGDAHDLYMKILQYEEGTLL